MFSTNKAKTRHVFDQQGQNPPCFRPNSQIWQCMVRYLAFWPFGYRSWQPCWPLVAKLRTPPVFSLTSTPSPQMYTTHTNKMSKSIKKIFLVDVCSGGNSVKLTTLDDRQEHDSEERVCVCVCMCVCARTMRTSTRVFICMCLFN